MYNALPIALIALIIVCMLGYVDKSKAMEWDGLVIHHSATTAGTVESIRRYHVNVRGWKDIGYHYVVYRDGSVHEGRRLGVKGAHAKGRNSTHIGICLIGKDSFTAEQVLSLRVLINQIMTVYDIFFIERHHEKCPGKGIDVEALERELLD